MATNLRVNPRAVLQVQDRSPKSRPVVSLYQSQTQLTRPVATGLGMQRPPGLVFVYVCTRPNPGTSDNGS